jgi:hypothetical protein
MALERWVNDGGSVLKENYEKPLVENQLGRTQLWEGNERDLDESLPLILAHRGFHGLGYFGGKVFLAALLAYAGWHILEKVKMIFIHEIDLNLGGLYFAAAAGTIEG